MSSDYPALPILGSVVEQFFGLGVSALLFAVCWTEFFIVGILLSLIRLTLILHLGVRFQSLLGQFPYIIVWNAQISSG